MDLSYIAIWSRQLAALGSRYTITLSAPDLGRADSPDLSYIAFWSTHLTALGLRRAGTLSAPDSR